MWQVYGPFQLLIVGIYGVTLRMASQGSSVDTCVGNPGVSPTSRLVTGTSVLDTIIPSSIVPHAIPGASTSADKYAYSQVMY